MSMLDRLKALGRQVQEAAQGITSSIIEIRGAITAKRSELEHARSGSLPVTEVIARFDAWVNETGAHQAREQGPSLVCHKFGAPPGHSSAGSPWIPAAPLTWGVACLFLGPQLKSKFAELARTVEYMAGPPAADRAAVVAKLEGELAELEGQEEQLIDEALAAGVTIAHRPEVVERRERERRRRESSERTDADRVARESAVDARHEPRVARSQYLERH